MKFLSLEESERLSNRNKYIYWEGWDLLLFTPRANAFMIPGGHFKNGQWGVIDRVKPNEQGKYKVPRKFI
jgi:hypothetical protein